MAGVEGAAAYFVAAVAVAVVANDAGLIIVRLARMQPTPKFFTFGLYVISRLVKIPRLVMLSCKSAFLFFGSIPSYQFDCRPSVC